jgi:ABC-type enterochelin transport system substrate-binding protein
VLPVAACVAVLVGCGQHTSDSNGPVSSVADEATTRTVQHAFGEAIISTDPQRVAVLDGTAPWRPSWHSVSTLSPQSSLH